MIHDHIRIQSKLINDMGEVILEALRDPNVTEVMLNNDGSVWVDTYSSFRKIADMKEEKAKNFINTIASIKNTPVTEENPDLAGELYLDIDGEMKRFRFQVLISPVVPGPIFNIRKPAKKVYTLADYLEAGIIDKLWLDRLKSFVADRKSILIVGGPNSGKTTLCNAILDEINRQFPNERMISIEDSLELQCNMKNCVQLCTSYNRSMNDLLYFSMRLRPDRIVVGEVRGKEAHSLIKALNTGLSGGLSTIHANSCREGLLRLEQLVEQANVRVIPEVIASAIDVIVFISKSENNKVGREITEVLEVVGFNKNSKEYITRKV